jgi:histidine triad (HIT) family protein
MDIAPLALGHVLVVPKTEVDRYFDLGDGELSELNVFAKKVAVAIEEVVPCKRVGVAVIGLEVPHAHVHLIPLNSVSDINFEREKLEVTAEELAVVAEKISRAYRVI